MAAGFKVQETRSASATVAVNRVISQVPDGDSVKEAGGTVTIELSTGPEQVAVPTSSADHRAGALGALDAFKVTVEEREDDEAIPAR